MAAAMAGDELVRSISSKSRGVARNLYMEVPIRRLKSITMSIIMPSITYFSKNL